MYLLVGARGMFRWNDEGWWRLLRLATSMGWAPTWRQRAYRRAPQSKPSDLDWEAWGLARGIPRRPTFGPVQAEELAAALERAVECLPDEVPFDKIEPMRLPSGDIAESHGEPLMKVKPGETLSDEEFFAATRMRYLKFIEFCRAGGFEAWPTATQPTKSSGDGDDVGNTA